MSPTLKSKQIIVVSKLGISNLKRGDIVLYQSKNQNSASEFDFIGRIIGLPTESIRIENGSLYIDNNIEKFILKEKYLGANTKTKTYEEGKWFKIGEFEYFVLTDKRENIISIPSRIIQKNDIKGILL